MNVQCLNVFALVLSLGISRSPASESVLIDAVGKQPRVTLSADGTGYLVYARGNQIVVRHWDEGGQPVTAPVEVATLDGLLCGMHRGPQIAATDKAVVVAAIGKAGDVIAWRSIDRGTTWGAPVTINDHPKSAREGLFSLAASGERVWAVWLDLRSNQTEVYAASALVNEAGWSTNRSIYRSPDGSVCECCQPTVAGLRDGGAAVMWRNQLAGARDLYACTIGADGTVTTPAMKLGSGTWPLNACPMDGGGIATGVGGQETIWRRDRMIFATRSTDPTKEWSLGVGRNGSIADAGGVVLRVWQRDADIVLARDAQEPAVIGQGSYPVVAADGRGTAVVTWEAADGVRVATIPQ